MKVLHIGKYYPPYAGGMEHFLADLHNSLCNSGIKSSILVHRYNSDKISQKEEHDNLYQVPILGTLLYTPVCPLFPFVLNRTIKKIEPDILHLHMPNISAFWTMALSCARHIPWIIHWHSDVIPSEIDKRMVLAYKLYKPFESFLLKKAKKIIVTSAPYLNTSKPLSFFQYKCQVVPLGIDPKRFNKIEIYKNKIWSNNKYKILAIGRLTYYKGFDILIKALKYLANFQVMIIGDGEMKAHLQALISQLDLNENVKLTGFLRKEKLQSLLATCDCLCLPSIERTEAFGLVILEAMLFSKPVVASDLPGPAWIVEHNKTGMLFPPGDVKKLAESLKYIMQSPGLREQMGKAALDRFNNFFRMDKITKQIIDIYLDIIK